MGLLLRPLTMQRFLAMSAGVAAAGASYVTLQRLVWRNAADVCQKLGAAVEQEEKKEATYSFLFTRAKVARSWNMAVDSTIGSLARELALKGL